MKLIKAIQEIIEAIVVLLLGLFSIVGTYLFVIVIVALVFSPLWLPFVLVGMLIK